LEAWLSKLVLKGAVIVLGFALFFTYSYVYQNDIFTKITLGVILNVISDISSLKEWAEAADFYHIGLVTNIIQASLLSVIFGFFLK
jgi:hypothetical protein